MERAKTIYQVFNQQHNSNLKKILITITKSSRRSDSMNNTVPRSWIAKWRETRVVTAVLFVGGTFELLRA